MNADDKVNILLVDDQPGKLLAYQAMLDELGENLITASSGREALEHLLRTDVTIVLMDVSMPELDGFELAAIIRDHPRYQKTAIIFVSAVHLTDLDRLKGYASGAVDYVSVPVVPELLRAKVKVFAELYRKTREAERLNQELERRVAERTAELEASTAKQVELTERLREADQRKDEFLASLGHELRNPLAPIVNATSILRVKVADDPDLNWCREVIERQTRQLTRLVDDLLDVSRITRGKITLRVEPVDVAAIVTAAIETCRPMIDMRRHDLSVRLPEQPLIVQGDPARLTQIVSNLLSNAAKYQDEEGRIELTVERTETDAVLTVSDRGIGIVPESLPSVFDLFSQARRLQHLADDGLGIGLALVKNLTELHGGSIEAMSDGAGKGSRFVVRLPRAVGAPSSGGSPDETTAARFNGPPLRILVVDDNRDAATSLATLLRLGGHHVTVAHDGPRALELAAAERPEIVFLDLGMPEMDGYEICRRARALGLSDTRIIAMTGYGQAKDRERSKAAGFDGHSVKPVGIDELVRLLAEHATRRVS
jgi:signal transduction histidine kinase